jgi:hypothetical protein
MTRLTRALTMLLSLGALSACSSDDAITSQAETPTPATDQAQLAVAASNSWTAKAPMPNPFIWFGAATVTNPSGQPLVYVLGGAIDNDLSSNIQVLIYNVATNAWAVKFISDGGAVFRSRPNGLARIGDVLYMTGGFNIRDGLGYNNGLSLQPGMIAYRPSTNTVTILPALPNTSADGVTGVINGRMYVLIGTAKLSESRCNSEACPLGTFRNLYRYDPVTKAWTIRAPAPHFHKKGVGGVINGKLYVVGGFDSKGDATRNLDVYNPSTNSWATGALMPKLVTGLKASVLQNKLYVVSTTATYAYNPATNTWALKAAPPVNTAAQAEGSSAVTITVNGQQRMVVVGGREKSTGGLRPTSLYTP